MKALSIQQPWAWLIVNGYKPVENRDWPTRIRGTFAVHAGKTYDGMGDHWVRRNFPEIPLPPRDQIPMGGIVGTAEIVDCVTELDSAWFQGRFGFCLAKPTPCTLIPLRGQLGFFEIGPTPVTEGRDPGGEA